MRVFSVFMVLCMSTQLFASAFACDPGQYPSGPGCAPCDEGWYCLGGETPAHKCPDEFPNSTAGTVTEQDCYKLCSTNSDDISYTTANCGITKYSVDSGSAYVSCKNNDGVLSLWTASDDYHAETSIDIAGEYGCYLNNRPCSEFNTAIVPGSDSKKPNHTGDPDQNNAQEEASWDDNRYNINNCRYVFESHDDTTHCLVKVSLATYDNFVQTAGDTINYTQSNNHNFYYCKSCDTGYTPSATSPGNGYMSCENTEGNKACQCTQSPAGYYTTCTWDSSMALDACVPAACPVGQTSPASSFNSDACHYSETTQFCDGDGNNCFQLRDLNTTAYGSLDPTRWHQD